VIVTDAPTAPDVGERLVILGAATTVKLFPLLATPDTVTTTFPVVAPVGTLATMLVALQLVIVAVVPLNLTVLVPWVDPKPVPVTVTDAPRAPVVGDRLVMLGAATATRENESKKKMKRIENSAALDTSRFIHVRFLADLGIRAQAQLKLS
jgi:hypothetical protein